MTACNSQWWQTLFDEKYLKTYVDRVTDEDTQAQLDFIRNTLEVPSRAAILDLACGYGRVSIPLAREGFLVTGFDYSDYLLNVARREAEKVNLSISFVQGDMRHLVFENQFDAIVNLFTSFGYFETVEDDRAVLKGVHHALKRDGVFLLDFANSPKALGWLYENGEIDSVTGELVSQKTETLSNGLTVHQIQRLNVGTLRWQMTRTWQEHGQERSYRTNVRMYFLAELRQLMKEAGLEPVCVYGDFDGSAYSADSERMLILARKRARVGLNSASRYIMM